MIEKRFWLTSIVYDGEQRFVRDNSLIGEKSMSNNEVVDLLNSLSDENEQLKSKNRGLQSELQIFKEDVTHSNLQINKLADENDQLKISSTMYHNLFKEFQRQMQGVKSIYDLDSKDFEDLIELSKGNVFDDEIGWVHLPIEELQE